MPDSDHVKANQAKPDHITIFDTTLRDGEQSPGCSMNGKEKVRMGYQLDRLGVDIIEAGFPIASEGDFDAVRALAREIRRPIIAALGRSCPATQAQDFTPAMCGTGSGRHKAGPDVL